MESAFVNRFCSKVTYSPSDALSRVGIHGTVQLKPNPKPFDASIESKRSPAVISQ